MEKRVTPQPILAVVSMSENDAWVNIEVYTMSISGWTKLKTSRATIRSFPRTIVSIRKSYRLFEEQVCFVGDPKAYCSNFEHTGLRLAKVHSVDDAQALMQAMYETRFKKNKGK